jgi:hypothetical protein
VTMMSNPFAHDTGAVADNASTDFSFSEDQGVPNIHLESFMQAMDAPADNLGEEDYRNSDARLGGDEPIPAQQQSSKGQAQQAAGQQRAGQYPRPYAP